MAARYWGSVSLNWILERPEGLKGRYWRNQEVQGATGEIGQLMGRPVGVDQLTERPVVCVCVKPADQAIQEPVSE